MTNTMNRRTALGALVALPALGVPGIAVGQQSRKLCELIAAHEKRWKAFIAAMDGLEAASLGYHTRFVGMPGSNYRLGAGQDNIEEGIIEHFEKNAEMLAYFEQLCPESTGAALAALECERDSAIARLDAIFAPHAAADERYHKASEAESDALMAICEHHCQSQEELIQKIRFLKEYEADLTSGQYDAIFDAILPEGESEKA